MFLIHYSLCEHSVAVRTVHCLVFLLVEHHYLRALDWSIEINIVVNAILKMQPPHSPMSITEDINIYDVNIFLAVTV